MFLLNFVFYCVFQHFEVDTKDLADLAWSPDGRVLCLWESLLRVSWSRHSQYCSTILTEFRLGYLMDFNYMYIISAIEYNGIIFIMLLWKLMVNCTIV